MLLVHVAVPELGSESKFWMNEVPSDVIFTAPATSGRGAIAVGNVGSEFLEYGVPDSETAASAWLETSADKSTNAINMRKCLENLKALPGVNLYLFIWGRDILILSESFRRMSSFNVMGFRT
jgi:hypothetical protein